ncbi:MAG TPA: response regulator transcription factor [Dehalococcoidia bacterium]|nr:response regulator transcription factor [Dehalococcoidia bacterium]
MRIAIVDGHCLVRAGIAALLREAGLEVVGEAAGGEEALAMALGARPDVILIEVSLPGAMSGVDITAALKKSEPGIRVVVLTASEAEDDLVAAITAGANGYLLKDLEPKTFIDCLLAVGRGEAVLPPRLTGPLLARLRALAAGQAEDARRALFTPREADVVARAAAGQTSRQIALALGLSESAVKFHLRKVMRRLELENRAQLVAWASRNSHLICAAAR